MTGHDLAQVIICIQECKSQGIRCEVTPSLVFGMASVIDPTVTMEQCKEAIEVSVHGHEAEWDKKVDDAEKAEYQSWLDRGEAEYDNTSWWRYS
ncbi:MAG TPA: hypothetical protein VHV10_05090 [Ktedonobacteraceae bacterium]|jgi:hypothetical protein|nr:hypothetical protein [Ktedonobacteraceae bacterium]